MTRAIRSQLAVALTLGVALSFGACSDSTPPAPEVPIVLLVQHPSLDGSTGAGTLQLSKARVVVRTADDNTELLDTLITIGTVPPAGRSSTVAFQTTGSPGQIRIEFDVELPRDTPDDGEDLLITVSLQNAAGQVLFQSGSLSILADPDDPPAPLQADVVFVGTGSTAASVSFDQATATVAPGATFDFTATARDASGTALPGTPIQFASLQPTVASVPDPAVGRVVAGTARGTATIQATLLTGQTGTATLVIQPPATALISVSGSNQTGPVGSALQPMTVRVNAADGLGVSGVVVTFAASSGTLSSTQVTTDANGNASTTLTPGPAIGAVTVTATAAGLAGSPVTFNATGTAGAAANVAFVSQPVGGLAGATLAAFSVEVRDGSGNRVTTFTGNVTVALETPPVGVALGGTATVAAVAGLATFNALTVTSGGADLRLRATAAGVAGTALSNAFTVTAGVATKLVITQEPSSAIVGQVIRLVIEARTASNTLASNYNASITAGMALRPAGASMVGITSAGFVNGVATLDFTVTLPGEYQFFVRSTTLDEAATAVINVTLSELLALLEVEVPLLSR